MLSCNGDHDSVETACAVVEMHTLQILSVQIIQPPQKTRAVTPDPYMTV